MLYQASHFEESLSDSGFSFETEGFYYWDEYFHYVADDSSVRIIEAWEFGLYNLEVWSRDLSYDLDICAEEARELILNIVPPPRKHSSSPLVRFTQAKLAKSLGFDACRITDQNGILVVSYNLKNQKIHWKKEEK